MIHNLKNLMRPPRKGMPLTVAAMRLSTIDMVSTSELIIFGEQS
ncbi:Uncharacterised protein [Pseudomonas putida]|jgi:hypothetical protein|nr:hypothetical protein SAMN05216307_3272 [Pseudomonas putida]SMQ00929.1 hypothetical protein SAMN05216380_1755 [Pseudomonas putida]VEE40135.1 Uncharacterised protein [Pseudomonas putida]VTQ35667.1 Uncharacterised protein [Pseudomonas putida]